MNTLAGWEVEQQEGELPPLPTQVDPERWLEAVDGQAAVRKFDTHGCMKVDLHTYYIKQQLFGQHVVVLVNAQNQAITVWRGSQCIKQVPIKGLQEEIMSFERFAELMREQARSEARQLQMKGATLQQQRLWR